MGEELKSIHARRLWLDATSIIGLISAVIVMTWMVSNERNDIKAKLEDLTASMQEIAARQAAYNKLLEDQWTRGDMENFSRLWCKSAELSNKGWVCPELSLPSPRPR